MSVNGIETASTGWSHIQWEKGDMKSSGRNRNGEKLVQKRSGQEVCPDQPRPCHRQTAVAGHLGATSSPCLKYMLLNLVDSGFLEQTVLRLA